MSDHLARSFDRSFDSGNRSLEARVSSLEAAARAAHEQKMRELEEESRKNIETTGFYKGVMAAMMVGTLVMVLISLVTRN